MGTVFNIQPFSIHDGPGVRTAVFLKGCGLRCGWCHNPESQSARREILFHGNRCARCGACVLACPRAEDGALPRGTDRCLSCGECAKACFSGALEACGYEISVQSLAEKVLRDKPLFDKSGGGVTFSGGEPLLQWKFVRDAARILRENGVHLAVETCLFAPEEALEAVLPRMDLVYADVKCFSDGLHQRGTGQGNGKILQNLKRAMALSRKIILRTPVIPGFNDDAEDLARVAELEAALGAEEIELMTFHNTCAGKYEALGRPFDYADAQPPTRETMEGFADIFRARGLRAAVR